MLKSVLTCFLDRERGAEIAKGGGERESAKAKERERERERERQSEWVSGRQRDTESG